MRTVYLDLNHWIGLSQAATGHPTGLQYRETLHACRAAADAGVVFPLSSVTYSEVSKIKDPQQRARLAEVMEELSGFRTIACHSLIVTMELDAAVSTQLGVPSQAPQDHAYLGSGVGYTLGQVLTPTFVNLPGDERICQVEALYGDQVKRGLMRYFERFALRGPADEAEAAELRLTGWDPHAAWNSSVERATEERAQAGIFDAMRTGVAHTAGEQSAVDGNDGRDWRKGRLRDLLAVRELLGCVPDSFERVLCWYGRPSYEQLWGDRDGARAFVRQMPSSEVAIELKRVLHRDAGRAANWKPNDVNDIDQMAMAVPYCNVVVTEKAAADALKRARLDERCGTTLLRNLNDLAGHL